MVILLATLKFRRGHNTKELVKILEAAVIRIRELLHCSLFIIRNVTAFHDLSVGMIGGLQK